MDLWISVIFQLIKLVIFKVNKLKICVFTHFYHILSLTSSISPYTFFLWHKINVRYFPTMPPFYHVIHHFYLYRSSSLMSVMAITLACTGVPFSHIVILQFLVQVSWIRFSLFRILACLAISPFLCVRYSFTYTPVPFKCFACFSTSFLYFLLTNQMMMLGLLGLMSHRCGIV